MDDPAFTVKKIPGKIVMGGSSAGLQTQMAVVLRIFPPAGSHPDSRPENKEIDVYIAVNEDQLKTMQ